MDNFASLNNFSNVATGKAGPPIAVTSQNESAQSQPPSLGICIQCHQA